MKSTGHRLSTASQAFLRVVPDPERVFSIVEQAVVVALRGALTAVNVPMVRSYLLTLVDEGGPEEIIVDLLDVSSIDEAGARSLLEAHRIHRQRHGCLRLGAMSVAEQPELLTGASRTSGREWRSWWSAS